MFLREFEFGDFSAGIKGDVIYDRVHRVVSVPVRLTAGPFLPTLQRRMANA